MAKREKRDFTFTILSFIGILLVELGHLGWNVLDVGGVFPYYSFHVLLFVFISGYFYKTEDENDIKNYIIRKVKRLMVPYFVFNLMYGILIQILEKLGYYFGHKLTLTSLFVEPFLDGHQYGLNSPAWFVPALFLLEICNILARKVFKTLKLDNEYVIMVLYLIVGLLTVYLAKRGSVYDYYRIPGRLMFMAPALQFGRLYKAKLEKKKKIPELIVMAVMLIINLILYRTQAGLNYSVVWVSSFANSIFIPYVSTVTGIVFWLEISKLISQICKKGVIRKVIDYLGSHTFDIMMNHLLGFFMVNLLLKYIGVVGFDFEKMSYDVYYSWSPNGCDYFKLIYVVTGIMMSLMISKIKEIICGLLTTGKTTRS